MTVRVLTSKVSSALVVELRYLNFPFYPSLFLSHTHTHTMDSFKGALLSLMGVITKTGLGRDYDGLGVSLPRANIHHNLLNLIDPYLGTGTKR